jgi:hypothetical protein
MKKGYFKSFVADQFIMECFATGMINTEKKFVFSVINLEIDMLVIKLTKEYQEERRKP